jgi:hypothetical protein
MDSNIATSAAYTSSKVAPIKPRPEAARRKPRLNSASTGFTHPWDGSSLPPDAGASSSAAMRPRKPQDRMKPLPSDLIRSVPRAFRHISAQKPSEGKAVPLHGSSDQGR